MRFKAHREFMQRGEVRQRQQLMLRERMLRSLARVQRHAESSAALCHCCAIEHHLAQGHPFPGLGVSHKIIG